MVLYKQNMLMENQEEELHDDTKECIEELGLHSNSKDFRVFNEHKENREDTNGETNIYNWNSNN